jgi:hypothetical protein
MDNDTKISQRDESERLKLPEKVDEGTREEDGYC